MPSGFTRQLSGTGIAPDRGFARAANQLTLWAGKKGSGWKRCGLVNVFIPASC